LNISIQLSYGRTLGELIWERVELTEWRGSYVEETAPNFPVYDSDYYLIKEEIFLEGKVRNILRNRTTGLEFHQSF